MISEAAASNKGQPKVFDDSDLRRNDCGSEGAEVAGRLEVQI